MALFVLVVHSGRAQQSGVFTIVVASIPAGEEAERYEKQVTTVGLPVSTLYMETGAGMRFRVCVGRFSSMREAMTKRDNIAQRTKSPDAWVLELPKDYTPLIVRWDEWHVAQAPAADTLQADTATADTLPPLVADSLFLLTYTQFATAWAEGHLAMANTYLHPEVGIYVLYRYKGSILLRQFRTLEDFQQSDLLDLPETLAEKLPPQLRLYDGMPTPTQQLPDYYCEGAREGYAASGFFAGKPISQKLILHFSQEGMKRSYLGQPLTPAESRHLTQIEQSITAGVVHTDGLLLRGLYFAQVHGHWYLTAIDMVNPCD